MEFRLAVDEVRPEVVVRDGDGRDTPEDDEGCRQEVSLQEQVDDRAAEHGGDADDRDDCENHHREGEGAGLRNAGHEQGDAGDESLHDSDEDVPLEDGPGQVVGGGEQFRRDLPVQRSHPLQPPHELGTVRQQVVQQEGQEQEPQKDVQTSADDRRRPVTEERRRSVDALLDDRRDRHRAAEHLLQHGLDPSQCLSLSEALQQRNPV
ncbi:hypothetical protein VB773_18450 [Haloarculaceae archaeon H-GB2-1]|nr:hypothetical protein [Haloarculaceae archaeon H-GB11]MEA5409351.1 hypothetical protein [Haloarculaceae archaeon H-GB2-1]